MKSFKKAQVVMLPTENNNSLLAKYILDASCGGVIKEGELCGTSITEWSNCFRPQELYIVSDDEIKEGDYGYCKKSNKVFQIKSLYRIDKNTTGYIFDNGGVSNSNDCKKIITTTDITLTEDKRTYISGLMDKPNILPKPSQQFIVKYIESYNKGEIIEDILVEYENIGFTTKRGSKYPLNYEFPTDFPMDVLINDYELKINTKDNTNIVKTIKETWNRREVIELLKTYRNSIIEVNKSDITYFDKWIEENL